MRIVGQWPRWAGTRNEQAIANAREASTALSRARVEREEVELYLPAVTPLRSRSWSPMRGSQEVLDNLGA